MDFCKPIVYNTIREKADPVTARSLGFGVWWATLNWNVVVGFVCLEINFFTDSVVIGAVMGWIFGVGIVTTCFNFFLLFFFSMRV